MHHVPRFRIVLFAALLVLAGCSSSGRLMSFSSVEPDSRISVVTLKNPEGASTQVSNPYEVRGGELEGKAVKIDAPGKAAQYWFPPDESGNRVEVKVNNLPNCMMGSVNPNRPLRLILKAYQALSSRDYALARDMADKATKIDPTLAGPHIIMGLTYFRQGDRKNANLAFNKARALDPEDQEIVQLLNMVRNR